MTLLTFSLDINIKHTHHQALPTQGKNERVKRLAKGAIHTVPQAGLERTCVCMRIKYTNHEATV